MSEDGIGFSWQSIEAGTYGYQALLHILATTIAGIDHLAVELREDLTPKAVLIALRATTQRFVESENPPPEQRRLIEQALQTFEGLVDQHQA